MTKRILVVSSETYFQKLLKLVLGKLGYSVETTGTGREALLRLERTTYAGMFVDIRLPMVSTGSYGDEGIEVLRQARRLYPAVPVVMMQNCSLTNELHAHAQIMAEGAKAILYSHPLEPERVRQVVERWFHVRIADIGVWGYIRYLLAISVHRVRVFVSSVKNALQMKQTVRRLTKAAEAGSIETMIDFGHGYISDERGGRLVKAAEAGDVHAQYKLVAMYTKGYGVQQDKAQARKWIDRAAEAYKKPPYFW